MTGLTRDTWAEARDRKMLFVFGSVTLVFVIVALLLPKIDINIQTNDTMSQGLFQASLLGAAIWVLSFFLTIMFFIAVMSTAGLIPGMFQRGRAEYYLSKPIGRKRLLMSKFLSIWLVYGLMVSICGVILVAVMHFVHGIFSWSMVWVLAAELTSFFIWMSIVLLGGIWSGSYSIAIVSAFAIWIASKIVSGAAAFREVLKDSVLKNLVSITSCPRPAS